MDLSAEIPTQRVLSLLASPTPSCLPCYISGALSLSQGRDPTSMMQPPTRLKHTSTSSQKTDHRESIPTRRRTSTPPLNNMLRILPRLRTRRAAPGRTPAPSKHLRPAPRKRLRLLRPADPESPQLNRLEDVENPIDPPPHHRHHRADQRIAHEMVRRGQDRQRHGARPQRREDPEGAVRREAREADGQEERGAEVQRRHGGDGQLEAVVRPRGAGIGDGRVQHVDEAVFRREQARRGAAVKGEDDEGEGIVGCDGAADGAEGWGGEVGVAGGWLVWWVRVLGGGRRTCRRGRRRRRRCASSRSWLGWS